MIDNGLNNIILDNACFHINDYVFIGSTLWADIDKRDPIAMSSGRYVINDYKYITVNNKILTTEDTVELFEGNIEYIKKMCKVFRDKNILILSHHSPSHLSRDRRYNNGLEVFYCSNLEELILDNPQIKYWLHGHTHYPVDYYIGDCNILSNPKGYPHQVPTFTEKTFILK